LGRERSFAATHRSAESNRSNRNATRASVKR
jgi:hypothetical protein